MNCHYHPDRESTNKCSICGKPICAECGMEVGGNILCKDCVNDLIMDSLSSKASDKVNQKKIEEEPNEVETIKEEPVINEEVSEVETEPIQEDTPIEETTPQVEPDNEEEIITKNNTEEVKTDNLEQAQIKKDNTIHQESPSMFNNDVNYENTVPSHQENSEKQKALEDKYEKYLEDLYFDEPEKHELSLKEQLAQDKELEEIAPIEKEENNYDNEFNYYDEEPYDEEPVYAPKPKVSKTHNDWVPEKERKPRSYKRNDFHRLPKNKTKEPYSVLDILLTIILIILILFVVFYLVYLFLLSSTYPTFLDALIGLVTNPGELLGSL